MRQLIPAATFRLRRQAPCLSSTSRANSSHAELQFLLDPPFKTARFGSLIQWIACHKVVLAGTHNKDRATGPTHHLLRGAACEQTVEPRVSMGRKFPDGTPPAIAPAAPLLKDSPSPKLAAAARVFCSINTKPVSVFHPRHCSTSKVCNQIQRGTGSGRLANVFTKVLLKPQGGREIGINIWIAKDGIVRVH